MRFLGKARENMDKQFRGALLLLLTAMIWGAAFVAQSEGLKTVPPFTFQAARQFLGFLVLLPVVFLKGRRNPPQSINERRKSRKKLILAGIVCGVFLFSATILQQFGLLQTTPGRSGFITALYILIVPLFGLFAGRRVSLRIWCSVAISIVGMYFLCFSGGVSFGIGELLTLACSFCFAGHILMIARVSGDVDGVQLSCVQFLVSSLLSAVCMLLFESPSLPALLACWLPIGYAGIASCGIAYTLQIIAQKDVSPTLAAILMSTESVFAALFAWLVVGKGMSPAELFGSALMFSAIILAQLPERKIAFI